MKDKHNVKRKDINRSLRPAGLIIRKILPYFSEKTFIRINRVMNKVMKGLWLSRSVKAETVYLDRNDRTKLRVLVCRSKKKTAGRPVTGLLWIHGGGYAIGLPEQDFSFASLFSKNGSCITVMPDYTKSVSRPYPAAADDCCLTLKWMYDNAESLGIDRRQLFVGGDSAGGDLAASVCLMARDRMEIPVAFQMPLYPMLDDRQITPSSQNNDAPVWNTKSNEAAWALYLKDSDPVTHFYAAPARACNLSGLPPACTYVGTIDPFHDETLEYFSRLEKAGTDVYLKEFEGCFHGFDIVCPWTKPAKEARQFLYTAFRYAQKKYRPD